MRLALQVSLITLINLYPQLSSSFTTSSILTKPSANGYANRANLFLFSSPYQDNNDPERIIDEENFSEGSSIATASGTILKLDKFSPIPNNDYATQRDQLKIALQRIDELKESIQWTTDPAGLKTLETQLKELEFKVKQLDSILIPPVGVSFEEYVQAIVTFTKLPLGSRLVYCELLEALKDEEERNKNTPFNMATDFSKIPEIVTSLYTNRAQITPVRMQEAVGIAKVKGKFVTRGPNERITEDSRQMLISAVKGKAEAKPATSDNLRSLFDGSLNDEEAFRREGTVQQLLPRVTRKDDRVATEKDLQVVLNIIDDKTGDRIFSRTEAPETISGGYVIRGSNAKKNSVELIEALDRKLPKDWDCTVSYLPDFTSGAVQNTEQYVRDLPPVLLLLKKDMSPTVSPLLTGFTSIAAGITTLLFCIGIYGGNDLVTSRITEGSSIGDFSGVDWFNGKIVEILLPLILIQTIHEIGHWAVAKRDDLKISAPTFLPFWQLPFMGAQTQILEPPKNFKSLFDFAFIGPFLGILASLGFLFTGLQATVSASPETAQYFASLPVSLIKFSTLGGTIIDSFYGGSGFVTLQDAKVGIPLHPFAIAGYAGLIIQTIDLLPLGANDGGRLSQSLFGRMGHSVAGGATWVALLLASLFGEHTDILVTAWIVYNFLQDDPEIPCRDEVENVDLVRSAAALGLWFFAALTLVPMS